MATRRKPSRYDPITRLEHVVLRRIAACRSPWGGHGRGTRIDSQAVARLERKGYVRDADGASGESLMPCSYRVTDGGKLAAGFDTADAWNKSAARSALARTFAPSPEAPQ